MTKLSSRKTRLCFTTDAEIRYRGRMRAVIIEVENGYHASTRLAGTRQRYPFSWEWLFSKAAALFAEQERIRRREERTARRKARA